MQYDAATGRYELTSELPPETATCAGNQYDRVFKVCHEFARARRCLELTALKVLELVFDLAPIIRIFRRVLHFRYDRPFERQLGVDLEEFLLIIR